MSVWRRGLESRKQSPSLTAFIYPMTRLLFPVTELLRSGARFASKSVEHKGNRSMAKESRTASEDVKKAMHRRKKGTLKSGRSGKKVTSKKQAIAIGLSEARREGKKVPARKKAS